MIRVWGRASSSNVQALMWCIGEFALDFERIDAGYIYGGTDSPEFLAMNPNGTVPVLCDGDGPAIWETGAILRYLASQYARPGFWPAEPAARAQVDKWAEWAKINVAQGFTVPVFWRVVRTPPAQRDAAAIDAAITSLNRFLAIAEWQLTENGWLAGPEFTLADIQFGHVLYRYFEIEIARSDFPGIRAYYDRLTRRAAFARHVMVSYEELRVGDDM